MIAGVRETATATHARLDVCSICGNRKNQGESWFLVTSSESEERLNIWSYENPPQHKEITRAVCGPKHARELVMHWMTTGCLEYPFGSSRERAGRGCSLASDVDRRIHSLCEIAVERTGILRAQRENPLALNTILDEMMLVLEPETRDQAVEDFENWDYFAIPETD